MGLINVSQFHARDSNTSEGSKIVQPVFVGTGGSLHMGVVNAPQYHFLRKAYIKEDESAFLLRTQGKH